MPSNLCHLLLSPVSPAHHPRTSCPPQNHVLDMDAKKASQPDWPTIRYMVATIQYGGRVTDDFDRALLDVYAERFYHEVGGRLGREGGGGRARAQLGWRRLAPLLAVCQWEARRGCTCRHSHSSF